MTTQLLQGELVRLCAINPETDAEPYARWTRDSEYMRFADSDPVRPWTAAQTKKHTERWAGESPTMFAFAIRTLADDRLVGTIDLSGIRWNHGDTFVGIGIGDRADWGKGYGTDAMRIILRFAFAELNLHRVSLNVFEYNPRAVRSYVKCGFRHEGCVRQWLDRDGKRHDVMYMGILREEWKTLTED